MRRIRGLVYGLSLIVSPRFSLFNPGQAFLTKVRTVPAATKGDLPRKRAFVLRSTSWIVDVAAILLVLAAMIVANTDWLFTRPGWLDPWIYFGFFRHYNVPGYLADNKKIARLPWILLGFAINKSLPTIPASFILHAGLFTAGIVALYAVAREMFGRLAAAIATLSYMTWQPIQGSAGWDYHNTLVPVVYFAAYFMLISSARNQESPLRRYIWFGAIYALAVHTNVLTLLVLPALLIRLGHLAVVQHMPGRLLKQWLSRIFGGALLGGAGITILLGFINVAFGRTFFFFGDLASRSLFLIKHVGIERIWWEPWSDFWWLKEDHTPMFEAILIAILAYAIWHWRGCSLRALFASSAACAMLEFIVTLSLFGVGQAAGHPLLSPFYMLMPAALSMFIALAALASRVTRSAAGEDNAVITLSVLLCAAIFGIQFVGRLVLKPGLFEWVPAWWENLPPMILILAGFAVAAGTERQSRLFVSMRARVAFASLGAVLLSTAIAQANTLWPESSGTWIPYEVGTRCAQHRALLRAVTDFDKDMFPLMAAGKEVLPWFDYAEHHGPSADCQLSAWQVGGGPLYAMGYGELNIGPWDVEKTPLIPLPTVAQLSPTKTVIALITNDRAYLSQFMGHLQAANPSWHAGRSFTIGGYGMQYTVHLLSR